MPKSWHRSTSEIFTLAFGGIAENRQDRVVDPTLSYPTVQWRDQWTLPLAISSADPSALYFGRQMLFRSHDGGRTWSIISSDLTRTKPGIPLNLDPATAADTQGVGASRGVIYTIAPSPLRSNTLWVGTDDGKIWQTADGGEHWRDVTPVQLTAWSKVAMLEASWFDPDEAYAAIDRHQLDDLQPYLYRTRDGGKTWQPIANGIPTTSYVNAIRSDPQRNGLLYAGSETGPYVSFDDGDHWLSLQLNMPNVSIRDFSVRGDSIAIATHGRGLWVLDDLAPLRQLSAEVAASEAWLFAPAPVVRVRPGDDQGERLPPDEPAAQNPPAGAIIDYELHTRPSAEVKLQIFDAGGSLVREWSSTEIAAEPNPNKYPFISIYVPRKQRLSSHPGLHQFVWDLRYAPIPGLGLHGPMQGQGPWAPPGHYAVRLSVDGHSTTRTLSLVKDPRIGASDADLRAQFTLAMTIERERAHGETSYKAARKALAELRDPAVSKICSREQAAMAAQRLTDIAGAPPPESPENSMGYPEQNLNSIHYQTSALESLESAVESADTAPTPDEQRAFATIDRLLNSLLHRLPSNVCGIAMR